MRQIYYSSKFQKSLKKMPPFVRRAFLEKEGLFLMDPFHPTLDTHKLHGKYRAYWAFTIIGQYRAMFKFMENEKDIGFINIGTQVPTLRLPAGRQGKIFQTLPRGGICRLLSIDLGLFS